MSDRSRERCRARFFAAIVVWTAVASSAIGSSQRASPPLRTPDVVEPRPAAVDEFVVHIAPPDQEAAGTWILRLPMPEAVRVIRLRPHSVRDPEHFRVVAVEAGGQALPVIDDPRTVRGESIDGSRLTFAGSLMDGRIHGRVFAESGDRWDIEPLLDQGPFAYSLRTPKPIGEPGTCGTTAGEPDGGIAGEASFDPPLNQTCVAQMACDADYQYFQYWGSVQNVVARIELVTNVMNVQFERDVGLTHQLTTILVRTTPGAPYTSLIPLTLLQQFRNEWNANQSAITRDVAQLFTGKNLAGTIIGLAWDIGEVCNLSTAYCLSQSDFDGSLGCSTDLSAHELGHLWNAVHCTCVQPPSTMNPSIQCANTFQNSPSFTQIILYAESVSCLTCELVDCNANGVGDASDIAAGTSDDCNGNFIPDECELASGATDCDANGTLDACDTEAPPEQDCNGNGSPDACELATGASVDLDGNGFPDECDPDCNGNGLPDGFDLQRGSSGDCNGNAVPDECEIASNPALDCDGNGVLDSCQLAGSPGLDCNGNGALDQCDIASGASTDLDGNGVPDSCDPDCNQNGFADGYDLLAGVSPDCNGDLIPDECQTGGGVSPPVMVNSDAVVDVTEDLDPVLAASSQSWVAIWTRFGGIWGFDMEVFFARSSDNGISWSAPSPILTTAATNTADDGAPSLAADGDGTFVAVWSSRAKLDGSPGTTQYVEIHGVRSTDHGASWSPPFYVHAGALGDDNNDSLPTIATDGAGTFIAVWQCKSLPGQEGDIAVSRSTDGGVTWSAKSALNSYAATDGNVDELPSIAYGGNGRWLVAWSTANTLPSGSSGVGDSDIHGSLSVDGGISWSAAFGINPNVGTDSSTDRDPKVAGDGAGGFAVAYRALQTGAGSKMRLRRSSNGVDWAPLQTLNPSMSLVDDVMPTIAVAGSDWRVVWAADGEPGTPTGLDWDLFFVRSEDAGSSWSAPLPVLSNAAVDGTAAEQFPALATDGSTIQVVFSASGVTGNDRDLRGVQLAFADCNRNSVADWCDIASGISDDRNDDGVPDECEGPVVPLGDLTGDGVVDAADLAVLLGQWGTPGPAADLNNDAIVDGGDLAVLLGAWSI
jgi:hypothetical protein